MAKASENKFPKIVMNASTGVAAASTGTSNLWLSTGSVLTITSSSGGETEVGASSPLTTKGDLYGYAAADARIPVGTDGQVLTADSSDTEGVSWQAAGIQLLATQSVTTASVIDFTSVSTGFSDLLIVGRLRSDRAATQDQVAVQVGNSSPDTGTNYRYEYANINQAGTAGSLGSTAADRISLANCAAANSDTGAFDHVEIRIFDYQDTSYWRTVQGSGGGVYTATVSQNSFGGGNWKNAAAAIDTIRVLPRQGTNFAVGSKLRLYGMG